MNTLNRPAGYMPQLDGLRALAFLAVLLHHTSSSTVVRELGLGGLGVLLFFVLSAFLITGILLRSRDECHDRRDSWRALTVFLIRRSLRIFPLYLLVLAIGYIVNVPNWRENFLWLATYTVNYGAAFTDAHFKGSLHFWSLAVEEQFYLFWPPLVLFLPKRLIPRACMAMFVIGPASRYLLAAFVVPSLQIPEQVVRYAPSWPTTSCLDPLAAGAMLAWLHHTRGTEIAGRIARKGLILGMPLLVLSFVPRMDPRFSGLSVLRSSAFSLMSAWVIHQCAVGIESGFGRFLENRVLRYLGSISYGLYVWHAFFPTVLRVLEDRYDFEVPRFHRFHIKPLWTFFVTLPVAAVSWHLFEKPINDLKRFFPGKRRSQNFAEYSGRAKVARTGSIS